MTIIFESRNEEENQRKKTKKLSGDMSKTKEELNAIKEEVETVSKKLQELTEEELEQITGGGDRQQSCKIYKYRSHYKECLNPLQGACKQCPGCELNLLAF